MSKAKMGHNKFDKFKKQEVVNKDRYATAGSVTRGYSVIDTVTDEVLLSSEYLWDVLDEQRRLNAPK